MRFSFSSLDTYRVCPFKYYLSYEAGEYEHGVEPKSPRIPLIRGKFTHGVLATWRKTGVMDLSSIDQVLLDTAKNYDTSQDNMDKLNKELRLLIGASNAYKDRYASDLTREWIAIEEPIDFTFQYTQVDGTIDVIQFITIPDALYRDTATKGIILVETKTTAFADRPQLTFNLQRLLMGLGVAEKYKEMPEGCEYDFIVMKQWKQTKSESAMEFNERVKELYLTDKDLLYRPGRVGYSRELLDRAFKLQMLPLIDQLLFGHRTMNDSACSSNYGTCPFIPACEAMIYRGKSWDDPGCAHLYKSKGENKDVDSRRS